ncbi:hypothetical protein [Helicobacter cappadocius]|uniref:Uncharacterized protein n=1 Tax=Helicobacter cappadocius TaxID=3063998 RepID=A0AA90PLU8_9HELI|nr:MULTISPECIES: hypothetical protein [unclassified Helicobacter]MDO7253849.1 hypothetical protein [Helicobacter sp. faydin-H75]MDP2539805.1 hypothetical protein [Helicobacter sp. faydin-H76]
MASLTSIFGDSANIDSAGYLKQIFNKKDISDSVESLIKRRFALWNWLFICRRQLYRDRICCGLKRDENLNVIRDKDGRIEFLERPIEWKKLIGLNDDHLYQKILLDRLDPMYQEFILMLGNGDETKGKDVLRKKLIKEEYALSTKAVEYARAKIFFELNAEAEYLRAEAGAYSGYKAFKLFFPKTEIYFQKEMSKKMDKDYEDKLADARLGEQRFDNWKKDKWDRDRAKIQIDFYVKEWIAENGEDRFVLFDNVNEDMIKPTDFQSLLTRYIPFVPKCVDLYNKYEILIWGQGLAVTFDA